MVDKFVLLTGGTGFIGSNIISYLKENSINTKSLSREEVWGDLSFDGDVDVIIHTAGKAHDLKQTGNVSEYYKANYELTKKLYDAFLVSKAKRFIFISSVKAIADDAQETLMEDAVPNPLTPYGKSKLRAEEYMISQELPLNKSYYILRPCMTHGPGNKGNLNLLFKLVKSGMPYPLGDFNNQRSFLSVQNLCFIMKELINRNDIPGGIYNVSDDEALSTNDVVTILFESLNKKPKLWKIPVYAVNLLAQVSDIFHLPLTTGKLKKLTESYVVSNEKIKKFLNKPFPITARKGLQITALFFLNTP